MRDSFDERFVELFDAHYSQLFRYLDRLSGDSDVAADIAQDAFVKLYQRGSFPDLPRAWLVTVAMNLFRNTRSQHSRRLRLLTTARATHAHSDAAPMAHESVEAKETQQRVRTVMNRMPERERRMLLLRAEGFSYREVATALDISETSIGTLLVRAQKIFRECYQEESSAS